MNVAAIASREGSENGLSVLDGAAITDHSVRHVLIATSVPLLLMTKTMSYVGYLAEKEVWKRRIRRKRERGESFIAFILHLCVALSWFARF